ncbi:GGDEF domain-containing protein [Bradyrhizobium sp. CCGUVB1N3]|uniref:GGDEF domain-containing protein n=1 Tax=Bradyrhizobium sp. CCGUVB1N3 TaxID=2949629 RepID=UPI0020B2C604|nr:GGDEF domain-containing protein [Bradyrhizobium sp. CCGUVB1N3]MCP3469474.1 GGDEF domain-containing protein [Bradyrhizobium sp. CCGUVB1N3]
MAPQAPQISTALPAAAQPRRPWQGYVDWLLSSPSRQPDDIHSVLLQQRTNKTKTLVVAVLASLLIASLSAALTGATWAYAWVAAEVVLGSTRLYLMMRATARARSDGRAAATGTPIWAGLVSVVLISAGCYQCVASGELPLILMAGIGLANLVGGIASRNAGTPRYGILMICILTLPFALATILSPIPFLFVIGVQTPVYTAGMIFLLLENHKILLDLHHSERNNRLMAHHDLLTGLPNRAFNLKLFSELLDGPWPEATSRASKLTVFCVDLDGFKGVNDRFGHAAGDAVLVAVAKRLRASVRDVDFVCRLGGDEFVVLLPHITDGEAALVAQRIISRVSEPFEFAPAARVGASIGLASAPRDGATADELLSAADRAMYQAKRRGKGGFVIHASGVEEITETVTLVPAGESLALAD